MLTIDTETISETEIFISIYNHGFPIWQFKLRTDNLNEDIVLESDTVPVNVGFRLDIPQAKLSF